MNIYLKTYGNWFAVIDAVFEAPYRDIRCCLMLLSTFRVRQIMSDYVFIRNIFVNSRNKPWFDAYCRSPNVEKQSFFYIN